MVRCWLKRAAGHVRSIASGLINDTLAYRAQPSNEVVLVPGTAFRIHFGANTVFDSSSHSGIRHLWNHTQICMKMLKKLIYVNTHILHVIFFLGQADITCYELDTHFLPHYYLIMIIH